MILDGIDSPIILFRILEEFILSVKIVSAQQHVLLQAQFTTRATTTCIAAGTVHDSGHDNMYCCRHSSRLGPRQHVLLQAQFTTRATTTCVAAGTVHDSGHDNMHRPQDIIFLLGIFMTSCGFDWEQWYAIELFWFNRRAFIAGLMICKCKIPHAVEAACIAYHAYAVEAACITYHAHAVEAACITHYIRLRLYASLTTCGWGCMHHSLHTVEAACITHYIRLRLHASLTIHMRLRLHAW